MPFEPIGRLLPQAIRAAGIGERVTATRVLFEAEGVIKRLWGEDKACYLRFVSFAEGNLKIEALAPAALQELKMQRVQIQNEINRGLGTKAVKQLVCVNGRL